MAKEIKICILVGINPIPCYVSAVYLIHHYQSNNIILLCSEENPSINQAGSFPIAERIKSLIESKFDTDILEVSIRCIKELTNPIEISELLCKICPPEHPVHLNYTGGTKTMTALAYSTLNIRDNFSSSYLDGRRQQMIINGHAQLCMKGDLRAEPIFSMSIDEIAYIHNLPKVYSGGCSNDFAPLLAKLNDLLDAQELYLLYEDLPKPKSANLPKTDTQDMKAQYISFRDELINSSRIREKNISESKINKYIDGDWLEQHLFEELNKNQSMEVKFYFDLKRKLNTGNEHFQIDIIAVYGYQLTLISVTTDSTKGRCKLKAFEAIHRARQLGGDFAKAVLVTLMPDIKLLEADLRYSIGSLISTFKGFGICALYDKTVYASICDYIKE